RWTTSQSARAVMRSSPPSPIWRHVRGSAFLAHPRGQACRSVSSSSARLAATKRCSMWRASTSGGGLGPASRPSDTCDPMAGLGCHRHMLESDPIRSKHIRHSNQYYLTPLREIDLGRAPVSFRRNVCVVPEADMNQLRRVACGDPASSERAFNDEGIVMLMCVQ